MAEYKKNWQQLSFTKPDQKFNWGPEEGKTILEVMENNPGFIEWCFNNVKKFKLGKKMQEVWNEIKDK